MMFLENYSPWSDDKFLEVDEAPEVAITLGYDGALAE